jgi:arabinose-5-phosphate isomerase
MTHTYIETARQVLSDETKALDHLTAVLDDRFSDACRMVESCRGNVIFCGVGHSGLVAAKSASNMSSLCHPAFFMHAGEAMHGDLRLVQPEDVVIFISNSGETQEILNLLPRIGQLGCGMIAIVGKPDSTLARMCKVVLVTGVTEEAGPLKFAGSSSALVSMAICDALAIAVAVSQGLTEAAYLESHPGGAVGAHLREKLNK